MSIQSSVLNFGMKWFLQPFLGVNKKSHKNIYLTRKLMDTNAIKQGYPSVFDVKAIDLGGVPTEHVVKKGQQTDRVLFYIHGGGFAFGSAATHRPITMNLCSKSNLEVYAPNYRMIPDYPAPAALDDCFNAYKALLDKGVDTNQLVVGGDSAGGNLTLALMLRCKDENIPLPKCLLLISPWLDVNATADSYKRNSGKDVFVHRGWMDYFADLYAPQDKNNPYISPIFGDFKGLPPTVLHIGDSELFLDDCLLFEEKAKAAGVEVSSIVWKDLVHVFHVYPFLPESKVGLKHLSDFISSKLRVEEEIVA